MPWKRDWGRDPRLDFFRGSAMIIIFVAHVPDNWLAHYIPARFGPSDAAEMFVFCSGFAAAIAFGGTFQRLGFFTGVRRISYRIWQIYWAHLCLFFTMATICTIATWNFTEPNYIHKLNLVAFFEHSDQALVGLLTLTYVPNLFDMLPMYIVCLSLMPIVLLLRRLHLGLAIAFSLGLYLAVWLVDLELPAEFWSDRPWFFNPFAWQLLFFTGFALSAGWLSAPRPRLSLGLVAAAVVIGFVPLAFWGFWEIYPELKAFYFWMTLYGDHSPDYLTGSFKTDLHPARYLHFLCLAYLAMCLFWGRERLLQGRPVAPIVKIGQQALPTFITSIVLSWTGGIVLDQVGRAPWSYVVVNAAGLAGLLVVAYSVAWYKSAPWTRKPLPAASVPVPAG